MRARLFWRAMAFVCLSISAQAGMIEICKDAFPTGSLSGVFSFTIAGQSGTFEAEVGACSTVIQLPDGPAIITEVLDPGTEFFGVYTFPFDRLVSFDPILGSATVLTVPGDISDQTVVFFTNSPAGAAIIPEPGSVTLLSIGLLSLILYGRRSRKRA